jgi:hypothetical protein
VIGVRIPTGAGNFSFRHRVQTGSGARTASYPMGTGGCFPGGKGPEREADHSAPSIAKVKECVDLYPHSPNTSSWRGAYLSTGTLINLLPLKIQQNNLICWFALGLSYFLQASS